MRPISFGDFGTNERTRCSSGLSVPLTTDSGCSVTVEGPAVTVSSRLRVSWGSVSSHTSAPVARATDANTTRIGNRTVVSISVLDLDQARDDDGAEDLQR